MENYSKLYPKLPIEIILFFSNIEKINQKIKHKTLIEFVEYYKEKYNTNEYPQPRIIASICEKLVENNQLSVLKREGIDSFNNSYICFQKNNTLKENIQLQDIYNNVLSCLIYGFKFIYNLYKEHVLAIEYTDEKGDKFIGTGFAFLGGIATAKHCLAGAKKIAIKNISKELLNNCTVHIHENELMDLAFIRSENPLEKSLMFSGNAEILDEVITLGYPIIPGYHNFLTVEKADVSARLTTSAGQIAAVAQDIWIKENLFLITAKIKGGNSGGPVISKRGEIVGVSTNKPEGKGVYDDLGYGTVIPINYLVDDIIENKASKKLDISRIEFIDFQH